MFFNVLCFVPLGGFPWFLVPLCTCFLALREVVHVFVENFLGVYYFVATEANVFVYQREAVVALAF